MRAKIVLVCSVSIYKMKTLGALFHCIIVTDFKRAYFTFECGLANNLG